MIALEGSFHGKTSGSLSVTHNPHYSNMYAKKNIETCFIAHDISNADLESLVSGARIELLPGKFFSSIAAVIVEPIQGEGGVHLLSQELGSLLQDVCKKENIPLIVDEIQSGLCRTGEFFAGQAIDLSPDYLAIGKSLGGGVSKVSALLIDKNRYKKDFGIIHTSTFAEDDWSSAVALQTLTLLAQDKSIFQRARNFEEIVIKKIEQLQIKYPQIIKEVRGKGFLLGIEFYPSFPYLNSNLMNIMEVSNLLTYVYSSYLLHAHNVRIAPTLSQSNTIRLEPSAYITEQSVTRLLDGIEDVMQIIFNGRYDKLFSHTLLYSKNNIFTKQKFLEPIKSNNRQITFLSHMITEKDFSSMDQILTGLPDKIVGTLAHNIGPSLESLEYFEQEIEGLNGSSILFKLRGLALTSSYFEESLRQLNFAGLKKVQNAVNSAKESNSQFIGLGQYTSIVSDSGQLLEGQGIPLTTGNGLTVGMTYRAFLAVANEKGLDLTKMKIGIVGVAGNICNVLSQLIADHVNELVLVHRESFKESDKFQRAVENIKMNSKILAHNIYPVEGMALLNSCDAIILGTNSTKHLLFSEHIKKDAFVIDISVPSNIDPNVLKNRHDVDCIQGGFVRLPLNQKFGFEGLHAPDGQVFACMAETITAGLLGLNESLSIGPLSKKKILEVLEMADSVGMELGSIKRMRSF